MFFLSWRQLVSRKKQTILILLGISLGTFLYVAISGLQLGMRKYISDQLLNNTAHVLISGAERMINPQEVAYALFGERKVRWVLPPYGRRSETRLENYQGWHRRLQSDPDVVDFSPRLSAKVILSKGLFTESVGITAVLPDRYRRITSIDKYTKEGSFSELSGGSNNIVIGSRVAKNLGVRVGEYISVSTGRSDHQTFKVVGIVHFGNDQVDGSIAFGELTRIQTLVRSPGHVNEIAVALFDIDRAAEKAALWRMFGEDKVQDWQEANAMFMEMISVQDYSRYFITFAVLIVAAFGIYNVLTIMINQKKREIAILRAIGYAPNRILELVLYQGLLLGIGGGTLGLLLGYLMCRLLESINLNIEIGGSNHFIISYDWMIYVIAFIAANIAALIASFLPAHAASRMTPIDVIRSE